MRSVVSFVGLVLGGVIVLIGLHQAFNAVDPRSSIGLLQIYAWSMVAVMGIYFMGYAGMKYVFSKESPSRTVPPRYRDSNPSQHSKVRPGRNHMDWSHR